MDLLGLLRRNGPPHAMSTRELTERAMVSAGAISQRLARAEARGWVRRTPGPARQVVVELTDEGRETVDRVAGLIFAADDEALAGLSDRQRRDLAALLRRLTVTLGSGGPLPHVGGESTAATTTPVVWRIPDLLVRPRRVGRARLWARAEVTPSFDGPTNPTLRSPSKGGGRRPPPGRRMSR